MFSFHNALKRLLRIVGGSEERATDLIAWLDRGGFPPTILHQPDLDPDWNRTLALAGCAHALSVLNDEWRVEQAAFPP